MKKKQKCYIYTRVSTAVQVDGYSLDAQRDKFTKYAEYQDMEVVKEFSDAGHSGKNINGRSEFSRMLEDMDKLYKEIGAIEDEIGTISMRSDSINKKQLSKESIYRVLKSFDKIYSEFTDAEKKRFIGSFVERVEIYEEKQENGRLLKSIKFRFPVYYNGAEIQKWIFRIRDWVQEKEKAIIEAFRHFQMI